MKKTGIRLLLLATLALGVWLALSGNLQKKKVVCVGDSITYGSGVGDKKNIYSYPAVLQKKLGNDYQVLNYGLRGRSLLDYGTYPYTEEPEYPRTLEEKADIYILMLGTNDSKIRGWNRKDYKEQLRRFVRSYWEANKKAEIYLMQPPRCFPDASGIVRYGIQNRLIEQEIHQCIAEVGLELGVQVIDLYELTKDHPDWFADGVHPNVIGYANIAECIYHSVRDRAEK